MHISVYAGGSRSFGEETVQKLARFKPHLKQALLLRSIVDERVRVTSAQMLLQAMRDAAVLVDRNLRIIATNDDGARLLRAGLFLRTEKDVLVSPPMARDLLRELNDILRGAGEAEPRTIGVRTLEHGFCLYNITPISLDWSEGRKRDHAVIAVRQERKREADVRLLRALYGLTETEVKVARELLRGAQVRDISEKWRISHETVRSHVKNILSKTDCRRQSDLVRLVLSNFFV
jgi:DNA-binding CsgD family transcriptional regulator